MVLVLAFLVSRRLRTSPSVSYGLHTMNSCAKSIPRWSSTIVGFIQHNSNVSLFLWTADYNAYTQPDTMLDHGRLTEGEAVLYFLGV